MMDLDGALTYRFLAPIFGDFLWIVTVSLFFKSAFKEES